MTDDLVTRLRALADEHKHPLVGWEQRLAATLREAADALDRLHHSRVPAGSLMDEVRELEQERDVLKAKLMETEKARDLLQKFFLRARTEKDEARAEAAALRDALESIAQILGEDGYVEYDNLDFWTKKALSQPGPGAALLERMKKLEAMAEAARTWGDVMPASDLAKAIAALEEKP